MNKLQIGKMPQLPFEVSEAINQLRINLSFCGSDVKTIMITSSTPNEGKSFVTMQLWRMIAELGTPAVLIDCDFRKSEMRSKYGMSTSGQRSRIPCSARARSQLVGVWPGGTSSAG